VIDKENIITALKQVFDPEIPVNIWDLGLVYDIKINDDKVKLTMTMTSPTCPMSEQIMQMAKYAATTVAGVSDVDVELVWDPPWDISKMSQIARIELDLTENGW
jgi:FeS assembly SUF system protein